MISCAFSARRRKRSSLERNNSSAFFLSVISLTIPTIKDFLLSIVNLRLISTGNTVPSFRRCSLSMIVLPAFLKSFTCSFHEKLSVRIVSMSMTLILRSSGLLYPKLLHHLLFTYIKRLVSGSTIEMASLDWFIRFLINLG